MSAIETNIDRVNRLNKTWGYNANSKKPGSNSMEMGNETKLSDYKEFARLNQTIIPEVENVLAKKTIDLKELNNTDGLKDFWIKFINLTNKFFQEHIFKIINDAENFSNNIKSAYINAFGSGIKLITFAFIAIADAYKRQTNKDIDSKTLIDIASRLKSFIEATRKMALPLIVNLSFYRSDTAGEVGSTDLWLKSINYQPNSQDEPIIYNKKLDQDLLSANAAGYPITHIIGTPSIAPGCPAALKGSHSNDMISLTYNWFKDLLAQKDVASALQKALNTNSSLEFKSNPQLTSIILTDPESDFKLYINRSGSMNNILYSGSLSQKAIESIKEQLQSTPPVLDLAKDFQTHTHNFYNQDLHQVLDLFINNLDYLNNCDISNMPVAQMLIARNKTQLRQLQLAS